MKKHDFIYERPSRRHKWHGYPVEDVSSSIVSCLLRHHDWSKREKYPDAQLGIVKQEEWEYSLPSNYPMDRIIDKGLALETCKDEFDEFAQHMKNVTASVRRTLVLPSKEAREKAEELHGNIEACLEKESFLL